MAKTRPLGYLTHIDLLAFTLLWCGIGQPKHDGTPDGSIPKTSGGQA